MVLKNAAILALDDDPDVLTAVSMLLKTEAGAVVTERNPENLHALLSEKSFDVVLLDMNFSSTTNTGNEGLFWLKKIKQWRPGLAVVMVTAYGDIALAVRSVKEGASDFVVKPWHNEKLLATFREVLKKKAAAGGVPSAPGTEGDIIGTELLGASPQMLDIFQKIGKIGPTDANILILGENGTGKDLIARAVHSNSRRAQKPFVKVDVGALTTGLFESELFGYRKGAFTDAREDHAGRFEIASGGTLFLDEIGNISLQQQAKLLTALQHRQVTRLGSHEPIGVDIRLISATNLPLPALADEQRFRKDLLYRINTIEITVPPLREREGDIILLADHFIRTYGAKYLKPAITLSRPALEKLTKYGFPGNVRELQYIIERAVIMADGDRLEERDIIFSPIESAASPDSGYEETNLSTLERNAIVRAIEKNNGNITRAARELGLTRTALYRRLNKYDI